MRLSPDNPVSAWLRRRYPQRQFLDPDEVAANRNGELTPSQRAALNLQLAQESLIASGFMVLGGGLLLFGTSLVLTLPPGQAGLTWVWALGFLIGVAVLGLPGLVQGTRRWTEFFAARREIADSEIVYAEGRVVWADDLYTAYAGRKRLKPIYNKLNLPPGLYRFFYLRGGHWLLSAEKMAGEAQSAQSSLFLTLSQANRFSPTDLEQNRAGRLSFHQIPRLIRPLWIRVAIALPLGLWAALILATVSLSKIFSDPLTLVIVAIGSVWAMNALWHVLAVIVDVIRRQVVSAEGPGQRLRVYPTRGVTYYYYQIGTKRLTISRSAYNALIVGAPYRVYYAPFSRTLLSIEPLDETVTDS